MKIYTVVSSVVYVECDRFRGSFSTKEKARSFAEKIALDADMMNVLEIDLDDDSNKDFPYSREEYTTETKKWAIPKLITKEQFKEFLDSHEALTFTTK